jgi:hypothetical protein
MQHALRCGPFAQAQNSSDDDWLDYNNELRIGILEAYSGIFQGLGPGEGGRQRAAQHTRQLAWPACMLARQHQPYAPFPLPHTHTQARLTR